MCSFFKESKLLNTDVHLPAKSNTQHDNKSNKGGLILILLLTHCHMMLQHVCDVKKHILLDFPTIAVQGHQSVNLFLINQKEQEQTLKKENKKLCNSNL